MAFCSFSKDHENSYTVVENKFLTKYLPEADGFAVKVYLYGLYLCAHAEQADFTLASMAEVFKTTEENLRQAFAVWEDYDLVEITKEPFSVRYLPVKSAIGKPKKIRFEKYADFNKELQRKMQKVGKFIEAADYKKYMYFLEENSMQPQAFLLIAEYCINKHGEAISPSYIFNKAKKLLRNGCSTYEQVEKALSNYNVHEGDLIAIYNAMSIYQRTPDETDYELYAKWTESWGFGKDGVLAAAKRLKRGSMTSLDLILEELSGKTKLAAKEIEEYLHERDTLANLTFRLGRKLGVKVQNPAPYIDEYTEKWYNMGFEESSLLDLALFCLKTERGSFEGLHALVKQLFQEGIVSPDAVKAYLKEKNAELKLFAKIQEVCGGIRKNANNVALVKTWKEWNFNEEMMLEAAARSAVSSSPIPYMNKILSDWKQAGVFEVKNIPSQDNSKGAGTRSSSANGNFKGGYINPSIEAANAKADRDRYYSLLREKAQARVDKALKKANSNPRFKEIMSELSKMELSLAKAEMYQPSTLPSLKATQSTLQEERKTLLQDMGLNEKELTLQFVCPKCGDTGFLPSGKACDCYVKK